MSQASCVDEKVVTATLDLVDEFDQGRVYDGESGELVNEEPSVLTGQDAEVEVSVLGDAQRTGQEEEEHVVIEDKRMPYVISLMETEYGQGHRGVIATDRLEPRDIVQMENALVYVTHRMGPHIPESCRSFFGGQASKPYPEVSEELFGVKGALHITLCGLLMRFHEKMARLVIDPVKGLHGRVNVGKCGDPKEAYEWVKKLFLSSRSLDVEWPFEAFVKLFAVVQTNAKEGFIPLSCNVFGLGFFPGAVYFNHACSPNAIATMMPGKLCIQAMADINPGDEITIAYREVAIDLLADGVTGRLHYELGLYDGCRCKICSSIERPQDEPAVEVNDLSLMWNPDTLAKLQSDKRLHALVTSVIRAFGEEEGANAVCSLRQFYPHYFTTDLGEDDYCPDLALVVGELYCLATIHIRGQFVEDLAYWPFVYLKAVNASRIQLPASLSTALTARAYAAIMSVGSRDPTDAKGQKADIGQFLTSWIGLRSLHAQMFNHMAYLMLPIKAHDILARVVVQLHKEISSTETAVKLRQEQAEAEAAAKETPLPPKEKEEEEHPQTNGEGGQEDGESLADEEFE